MVPTQSWGSVSAKRGATGVPRVAITVADRLGAISGLPPPQAASRHTERRRRKPRTLDTSGKSCLFFWEALYRGGCVLSSVFCPRVLRRGPAALALPTFLVEKPWETTGGTDS
jgi:hypothetical protein